MDANDLTQLSEELINRLGTGGDLDGMMSGDIFPEENLYLDMQEDDDNEPDDVIVVHMDIREPLTTLQTLVEEKIGVELKGYRFWLQDAQELQPDKNLVDQCVKGEGLVQVNVQIQTITERINIVDVLKPTDAALAALGVDDSNVQPENSEDISTINLQSALEVENEKSSGKATTEDNSPDKPCLNWVLDNRFKKEQQRLKIPEDPNEWTTAQVKHWFQWAVREFNLSDFNMSDWSINGKELCALTHEQFREKLAFDPGNVFWTHLQLLKECKFVSIVHRMPENGGRDDPASLVAPREHKIMRKSTTNTAKNYDSMNNNNSGNNGQVQLWQFLLDLLTDTQHTDIIQWVGTEGEFKLMRPERVAHLWGEKKNKPAMNYEKLSRALRYYYDGDMISKVAGKRFAYKFDCDLKLLIGYNAKELAQLVNQKPGIDDSIYMELMKSELARVGAGGSNSSKSTISTKIDSSTKNGGSDLKSCGGDEGGVCVNTSSNTGGDVGDNIVKGGSPGDASGSGILITGSGSGSAE